MKKTLFLRFLRCLLITDLFDNLESGKRNYCFGKKSGKSLEFISWYLSKALTVVKKGSARDFIGSKAGTVKRTARKELLPGLSNWFLGELRCKRRRLEI